MAAWKTVFENNNVTGIQ